MDTVLMFVAVKSVVREMRFVDENTGSVNRTDYPWSPHGALIPEQQFECFGVLIETLDGRKPNLGAIKVNQKRLLDRYYRSRSDFSENIYQQNMQIVKSIELRYLTCKRLWLRQRTW